MFKIEFIKWDKKCSFRNGEKFTEEQANILIDVLQISRNLNAYKVSA